MRLQGCQPMCIPSAQDPSTNEEIGRETVINVYREAGRASYSNGKSTANKSNMHTTNLPPDPTRSTLVAITILVLANIVQFVEGQCPNNTLTSFERIGSVTIKDPVLVLLYTANNLSSPFGPSAYHHSLNHQQLFGSAADLTRQLSAASSKSTNGAMAIPITAECNNRCRRSAKCRGFLVDYARQSCYSLEHPAQSSSSSDILARSPKPVQLVPTHERTAYFEKVCLNLPAVDCERAWIYERVMGYQIHGHDDKIIEDVPSRLKCQEHCLHEGQFRCRSGEYDYITMQCRLSNVDRHIRPNSFRPTLGNVDYFENQCAPVGNQCDAFDRFDDSDLGRAEIMRPANSSDQCQQLCTQLIKAFICRSFTWNPSTNRCYLNSANTFTVGGTDKLIPAPGLTYYQRNDCIDLKLECDTTAMTLNLRTNEPFRGRMYVRDEPNACETLGRSALSSSLSIPFQPMGRCATRELPSRYSSVVVVQQHPLIQRKSDRYIKVVCDFQTSNKTITSSYNVVANAWTSTALINATSFAPKIRLRITDKYGSDITGAKLGDELYLRIEAETESVYDMVARSVLAKSGQTDESIVLIDKDGCPTDSRIFPPLKKLNRRTILGKFDAFKFSSDVVVRFQVDVQFCLNQCPMTSCDQTLQLLNANLGQLAPPSPEIYAAGSLTTLSPLPTITAAATTEQSAGSTQAPMPIQQQQQPQQQQPIQHQAPGELLTGGSMSNNNYLSLANQQPGGPFYGRHTSAPANQPLGSLNGSGNPSLEALGAASMAPSQGDSQTFDGAQPRKSDSMLRARSNHQPASNAIDSLPPATGAGAAPGELGELAANSNGHQAPTNRRRRSAEPLPGAPRHVPLQREIIVESSPSPAAQRAAQETPESASARRPANGNKSAQRDARVRQQRQDEGVVNRDELLYDLNGNGKTETDETHLNASLLCTTRHSLVLASLAFCFVQLLTIGLCLVSWMHRRRDTKFKVRHPIEERLY